EVFPNRDMSNSIVLPLRACLTKVSKPAWHSTGLLTLVRHVDPNPSPSHLLANHALLADCRFDIARGSGPGGQKRNKTSNAVRLTHLPTGIHVTATESRSLAE